MDKNTSNLNMIFFQQNTGNAKLNLISLTF